MRCWLRLKERGIFNQTHPCTSHDNVAVHYHIETRNCLRNNANPLNRKQNLCTKLMTINTTTVSTKIPQAVIWSFTILCLSVPGGDKFHLYPKCSLQISSVKQSFCSLKYRQTSIPPPWLKMRILLPLTMSWSGGFFSSTLEHYSWELYDLELLDSSGILHLKSDPILLNSWHWLLFFTDSTPAFWLDLTSKGQNLHPDFAYRPYSFHQPFE